MFEDPCYAISRIYLTWECRTSTSNLIGHLALKAPGGNFPHTDKVKVAMTNLPAEIKPMRGDSEWKLAFIGGDHLQV
jgi:hypothetical protein